MNYRPNMIARSLSLKKSKTIGVLLYRSRDRFSAALMAEIETAIRLAGYTAHFAMWEKTGDILRAYESMIARRVDGIISTKTRRYHCRTTFRRSSTERVPMIMIIIVRLDFTRA